MAGPRIECRGVRARSLLLLALLVMQASCIYGHQDARRTQDPNKRAWVSCLASEGEEVCNAKAGRMCPKGFMVDLRARSGQYINVSFRCDSHAQGNH